MTLLCACGIWSFGGRVRADRKSRELRRQKFMLPTTFEILRSALRADPSLSPADRSRILAMIRNGANAAKTDTMGASEPRLVRRAEAAARLSCGLRTVDKLAAAGVLPKRKLPNRQRAAGFLESDLNALIAGRTT